jgi:hypothetical protein
VLLIAAVAFAWAPRGAWAAPVLLVLGTAVQRPGLLLAGTLRRGDLAVANGLYLLCWPGRRDPCRLAARLASGGPLLPGGAR